MTIEVICTTYMSPLGESGVSSFPFLHHRFLIWFLKPFLVADTYHDDMKNEIEKMGKKYWRCSMLERKRFHIQSKKEKDTLEIYYLLIEHTDFLLHVRNDVFRW